MSAGRGDGNPQTVQDGYALLGVRLALRGPDERWELAVSGENLTDEGYCTLKFGQTLAGPLGTNDPVTGGSLQRCFVGEPRTLRLSAKVRY
ncbi:TonB-dependent receptor [Phenylobacterium sp. J426]|uniref:TonB-dependent receptor n=1 Tax=Phenylobacterium sp. J426 TaxID=2898439 RepID=UPI0027E26982|nr:TonB-dependent receptor [Phenylobacterium sp. J426]